MHELRIVSWNINGAKTKLEKIVVYNLLCQYDIIGLYEVKTSLPVSLSGYVSYRSVAYGSGHRGGTVVLVRRALHASVLYVDSGTEDQVWLRMGCMPNVMLGFVYVPPCDSPYFSPANISAIQERVKTADRGMKFVILGDLNSRFGESVRSLLPMCEDIPNIQPCEYPQIVDPINAPGGNARAISAICCELKLLVVNNLKTLFQHFRSKLTYRQASVWKSELDICIASPNMLRFMTDFTVWQDTCLPSDHAPIAVSLSTPDISLDSLYSRARCLGDHATLYTRSSYHPYVNRPLKINGIDNDTFCSALARNGLPLLNYNNVDTCAEAISDVLYKCCKESQQADNRVRSDNQSLDRWERLISDSCDTRIWQAIDWKGEYKETNDNFMCPDDEQFKAFFEDLFNPPNVDDLEIDTSDINVTMPVLDGEISLAEVESQIRKLKNDKAGGPDGICPGVFKLLPVQWITTIVTLFNMIFLTGSYPYSWRLARLVTIFKRGDRLLPANYRGINIISVLAKLYDMVLCNRLTQWFAPYREQAGSQQKRGCIEHIVTLRLLMDMARRKRLTLFITFVDFSQAYDRVPRATLFNMLKRLGCGALMLAALVAMYRATYSIIGAAIVTATVGVRQGSPTSCLLFVLFVNDLVKLMKDGCGLDGFLSWLHVLVLMDDTVILSTTREGMRQKLTLLNQFCIANGMIVNERKTKFFALNICDIDREPFVVGDITVSWCEQYIYLGSVFTSDGSVSSAIARHAQMKMCHILKFISFVKKNSDTPFYVKRKLFDAALMSAVLYGSESWLNGDLRPVTKLYNWGIKELLGVRMTTCNELCYLELGIPPLKALVMQKQRKFFRNMWRDRNGMVDDPWLHVVKIVLSSGTATSRYLSNLISNEKDDIGEANELMRSSVLASNSSRKVTYRTLNPNFDIHEVYCKRLYFNDVHRISFTRMRIGGHSLTIETGRWNRGGRGRLPIEERLCPCGEIQTELHVVESCPFTLQLRQQNGFYSWQQLMSKDTLVMMKIVHLILETFA